MKLGHQAPKGYVINEFNFVTLEGDYAYCKSHNFVYNTEVEKEKQYNAQPCYYTDIRFVDGKHNYYKNTELIWSRFKGVSLKACIRKVLHTRNIPLGAIVRFSKSWYMPKKKLNLSYLFKVKKENKLEIKYEITKPEYFDNFTTCERSKKLVNVLRKRGFIVAVYKQNDEYTDCKEVAVAYGNGKIMGFSAANTSLWGYSNGRENILWDAFGEFDKWSRCYEIPKTTSIEEIIGTLKVKPQ